MKKSVVISLVLLVAFTFTSSTGFAQGGETVEVNPLANPVVFITTEDVLVLRVGWAACTRGLVRAFITAADFPMTMNGELIFSGAETDQYFGPIYSPGPTEGCKAGNGTLWLSWWMYPFRSLPVGTNVITLVYGLDHPVTDGFDIDGDGRPDRFRGELEFGTVTVHVTAP